MQAKRNIPPKVAMVLSGGVSLGSYQAGAYARMHDLHGDRLHWVAGSSIGAVNAAIIAGNAPHRRVEQLKHFWEQAAAILPPPMVGRGPIRRAYNWFSAIQTRLLGRPELFSVRPPQVLGLTDAISIYDLSPLADKLPRYIDFDRLNGGPVRLSAVTTDLETGEAVVFDTGKGDRVDPEQLIASCGFLPDFEPTEIDGRLLGDGGLVANAPVDVVLGADAFDDDLVCFVVELFARDADRPTSLEEAAERRRDLLLANQTHQALEALCREHRLRCLLAEAADLLPKGKKTHPAAVEGRRGGLQILHLSYRPNPEEAGLSRQFDFSGTTLGDRWEAGASDMAHALNVLDRAPPSEASSMHRIRR
jgi:NTE family protein